MMTRLEIAQYDVAAAKQMLSAAKEKLRLAEEELAAALIEESSSKPHEWAGKTVETVTIKQVNTGSFYRPNYVDRKYTIKGIVTLCESKTAQYRNHWPKPGEWFVLSLSGLTAHKLHDDWKLVA